MQANTSIQAKRALLPAALAALVFTLGACGSNDSGGKPPDYSQLEKKAPPPLADLYKQGDAVIEGSSDDFQAQLDRLKGYPVVVNAWASWCGPCREEFPVFQDASAKLGTKIAFLGINTADQKPAAETFLDERPLPYPSYLSDGWDLTDAFVPGVRALPKTAFYDETGERTHVDYLPYKSVGQLQSDIEKYTG
jgi:thiol-disulfide isomerase/thioredoxin